ncbi:hypothetical protein FAZ69_00205 [Trinickia terrae]|uniref:Uncharacterized protein n=2 Tax=Trinickia terrae TaxID=2571161 RepID=A0A4U1IFZ4_9BURK|nr:hypothetical protein FAZ69_00205 [Trinickia terrae]
MQTYAVGMFVVFGTAVLLIALLVVVAYVFSDREGRSVRLKIALRKLGIRLGSIFVVCVAWNYYQDATDRAEVTKFHRELSDDAAHKGEYTAEYAYLPQNRILLRVYRTADMSLLAERTYAYPDAARLTWTADSLIYDTAMDTGGELSLPPTLFDKIMARLP